MQGNGLSIMVRSHILNWAGPSGWVWAFALFSSLTAQSVDELLATLGRDAEHPLSEEDQLVLEDVILDGSGISTGNLQRLSTLNILSDSDVKILRRISVTGNAKSVMGDDGISPELKALLTALNTFQSPFASRFRIQQYMSVSDDIRYRWRGSAEMGNQTFGFLLERDPEERKLIDHSAFYAEGTNGPIYWIIGDHQLHAGYGLTSWRTMPVRKGYDVISAVQRRGAGLKPYRSSHEYWGIRGAAFSYESPAARITLSVGRNQWDGTLDSTGIINLRTTGLHPISKNESEFPHLSETVLTGLMEITSSLGTIGFISSAGRWTGPDENLMRKSGSIFFSSEVGQSHFFGEMGLGHGNSKGLVFGYGLHSGGFGYLAHGRHYTDGFEAFRSNPVSEWSSAVRNEQGFFQSIRWASNQQVWSVYGDLYSQTVSSDKLQLPVRGQEAGVRWVWTRKSSRLRCQWAQESRTLEETQYFVSESSEDYKIRQTVKVVYDITPVSAWRWRVQGIFTKAEKGLSSALGGGIDFRVWWSGSNISIVMDWVVAAVDDYEARVYFWDVNLPGELRTAMYSATSHSPGFKIDFRGRSGYRIGLRYRIKWDGLTFNETSNPSGALTISAVL